MKAPQEKPLDWRIRLARLQPNGITRAFTRVEDAKRLTQGRRIRRKQRKGVKP
jgi:hypothetical protein